MPLATVSMDVRPAAPGGRRCSAAPTAARSAGRASTARWSRPSGWCSRSPTEPGRTRYELVTVVLTDLGDGRTEMHFEQRGHMRPSSTTREEGWGTFFARMDERLAAGRAATRSLPDPGASRSAGCRSAWRAHSEGTTVRGTSYAGNRLRGGRTKRLVPSPRQGSCRVPGSRACSSTARSGRLTVVSAPQARARPARSPSGRPRPGTVRVGTRSTRATTTRPLLDLPRGRDRRRRARAAGHRGRRLRAPGVSLADEVLPVSSTSSRRAAPLAIVLDDYHEIDRRDPRRSRLPPRAARRMSMSSSRAQTDPPLRLGRLRAQAEVASRRASSCGSATPRPPSSSTAPTARARPRRS